MARGLCGVRANNSRVRVALLGLLATAGCSKPPPTLTPPTELCVREAKQQPCRWPEQVERLMQTATLEILHSDEPNNGKQGARILTVSATDLHGGRTEFRVKWRALSTSHGLNDPRREVVVYAFQKLFLDPEDYVVSPTVSHCFELTAYRAKVDRKEKPTFPTASCVFGTLTYWLEGARSVDDAEDDGLLEHDEIFDRDLFDRNATYRRTLADMNLLNHLVGNGDTHVDQFVFTGTATHPRVYCVDYTISLSGYRNPTLEPAEDWSRLHVPALSARSLERLQHLPRQDLERLFAIEEFEIQNGVLVKSASFTPAGDLKAGIRWVSDSRLQVGFRKKELDYVWARIARLVDPTQGARVRSF